MIPASTYENKSADVIQRAMTSDEDTYFRFLEYMQVIEEQYHDSDTKQYMFPRVANNIEATLSSNLST